MYRKTKNTAKGLAFNKYPSMIGAGLAILIFGNVQASTDALRIKIAGGSYSDETVIRFLPDATADFDGNYDAWKLFSFNPAVPDIFTKLSSGDELTINSISSFTASVTMDVFVKIGLAGAYTLSTEEPGPFLAGVDIVMKDLATNLIYDLRAGNSYTVNLPVITQSAPARFLLFFSYPAATSIANATCGNCADGKISVTKAGESSWIYGVVDEQGNPVAAGTVSGYTTTITGLASGNYTLSITGNFSATEDRPIEVKVTPALLGATFMEFKAIPEAGTVALSWSTSMESNTGYFTVERSKDGVDYQGILNINAAGNSSALLNYTAADQDPYRSDTYYRIRLTDLNGDISYSSIVLATMKNGSGVVAYPNPASGKIYLNLEDLENSAVMVVISDPGGKEIQAADLIPGSNHETVSIELNSGIVPGIYLLHIIFGNRQTEEKIVINTKF